MFTSRNIALSASALAALACAVPLPAARADGGLTIAAAGAVFVGAFKAGEYIHGPRAIALSNADGDSWDSDPAGVTPAMYLASTRWGQLPHVGGWLSGNVLAKATSNGSKGSEMVTRSSGSTFENGIGKAEVEYSPKLAQVAGASYWGDGRVIASALATHTPGPKAKRPGGGNSEAETNSNDRGGGGRRSLVPWPCSVELSIPQIEMLVSGDSSFHTSGLSLSVYAFEAYEGSISDPDAVHPLETAGWSGEVLNEQIALTLGSSGTTFSVSGSLLNESMFTGSGSTRSLISPVSANIQFTMMIPEDWAYLDTRFDFQVEQEMQGAYVPAPGAAALGGMGGLLLLRRRRAL